MRLRHKIAFLAATQGFGAALAWAWGGRWGRRLAVAQAGFWAGLAAYRLSRFPFDFPLELNAHPWPAYYIHSEALFGLSGGRVQLSDAGVPRYYYPRLGWRDNPAYVAWWGLMSLNRYLASGGQRHWEAFQTQAEWLRSQWRPWAGGAKVWAYDFDWREGRAYLKAPWVSAMAQGLALSALARAYSLAGGGELLALAQDAARVFEIDAAAGGVRVVEDGDVYYEEYPTPPYPRILDGFAFALLGLYDLYKVGGDPKIERLFWAGAQTLAERIGQWDFAGCWSWYGTHGILCSAEYNKLNAGLLLALAQLTGDQRLRATGEAWLPCNLSPMQKALVALSSIILLGRFYWEERA